MRILVACMCVSLGVSAANAAVMSVGVESSAANVTEGPIVVNDISATFDGALGGQQIYVQLEQGSIYNTAGTGGDTAPNPVFVGIVPDLAYDTFVTMGGATSDVSANTGIFGGAVNLGGPAATSLEGSVISVAFAPNVGVTVEDQADYLLARISLTPDAAGAAFYFGSTTDGGEPYMIEGTVVDGAISFIPEPTTALLAGLAMVGVLARRK